MFVEVLGWHVAASDGGAVELEDASALEDAVDDGIGEILVVEHVAPSLGRLVGCEHHRAAADVALVDDMEQDVGGVVAVGEVADLVDHEYVRLHVARESAAERAVATCGREILDEVGGRGEERVEAVLKGAVGDGDGEVRLPATGLSGKDGGAAFGDEVGREQRADGRHAERRLQREVELLDGAQERKARSADGALQARAASMRDLLGDERLEEVLVGPLVLLGARDELAPDAPGVGE